MNTQRRSVEECTKVCDQGRSEVFRVFEIADVEVLRTRLDLPESECAPLWSLLAPFERERADRFRSAIHRRRFVVARARLRQLLAERLRIEPTSIGIVTTDTGKPKLAPAHAASGLEFNLSHSGSLGIYAFARDRPV